MEERQALKDELQELKDLIKLRKEEMEEVLKRKAEEEATLKETVRKSDRAHKKEMTENSVKTVPDLKEEMSAKEGTIVTDRLILAENRKNISVANEHEMPTSDEMRIEDLEEASDLEQNMVYRILNQIALNVYVSPLSSILLSLSNTFVSLSNIFLTLSDTFLSLSNIFVSLSNIFLTLSDIFLSLSNIFLTLSDIFLSLSNIFLTLSDIFLSLSNIFLSLSNIFLSFSNFSISSLVTSSIQTTVV